MGLFKKQTISNSSATTATATTTNTINATTIASSSRDRSNSTTSNSSRPTGTFATAGATTGAATTGPSTSANAAASSPSIASSRKRTSTSDPMSSPPELVNLLCKAKWDNETYSLSVARAAYGAAVVVVPSPSKNARDNKTSSTSGTPVILVAGGKSHRGRSGKTVILDTVEVFDPDSCNQAQLCPHRLSTARFSCGAFSVANDAMCILGGKDGKAQYLSSVELVTPLSSTVLPECNFELPHGMASFGVAVVGDKVVVIGGKTIDSTLDTVYQADLLHFVNASLGRFDSLPGQANIWERVDTMGTVPPRHSFGLAVDRNVCWMIGGFDGEKVLDSVGLYHSKQRKFLNHPSSRLSLPRSGLSSLALGKSIFVSGGVALSCNNSTVTNVAGRAAAKSSSLNDGNLKPYNITEVLVRGDGSKDAFFGIPNRIDCVQKDQFILQLGFKAFAIGHYDFSDSTPKPTCAISSMDLLPLRAFLRNLTIEGDGPCLNTRTLLPFPKPVVPNAPSNPTMSTDLKKLKSSVDNWKARFEEKAEKYRKRVSAAYSTAQMLHDEVVASLTTKIEKANQLLVNARPAEENLLDEMGVHDMIEAKRKAFELEKAKLESELQDRIEKRNQKFEALRDKNTAVIQKLETTVSDCAIRLQEYREQIESELSVWISAKNKDVAVMEGIVAGEAPSPSSESVDLTEDRKKIMRVFTGVDSEEPAEVSSEYGRQCTNNFDAKNKIGSGGFGVVYQGNDIALKRTFAFKRISVLVTNPTKLNAILQTFKREISTLKRVRHPNIVALYGYHFQPDGESSYLIYEYLGRGNVASYLKTEAERIRLPYLRRLRILSETLRALNFLHTSGCEGLEIQHRDIKPYNICLAEDWSAKLIDCGLARIERTDEPDNDDGSTTFFSTDNGLAGTDGYICRAYWNGLRPYKSACDMYSFGIVMMELIVGKLNRQCKDHPGDFFNQFVGSISGVPVENGAKALMERCDELVVWNEEDLERLCQLAVKCLSMDLSERPTAQLLAFEVNKMLLRGEIGELPESFSRRDTAENSSTPRCAVCNEARISFEKCKKEHVLCNHCITQEAIVASNIGSEIVRCPIMECGCTFDIHKDLYAIVPKDIYNKTTAEGRILNCLERIERGQNHVMSQISMVRKGVNRGLQAMASLTASGSSPCPKLVWIIPGSSIKIQCRKPETWIKGLTDVCVKVYFVCEHSFTPITRPVILNVKKKWLRRVAPALKISIFVLRLATLATGLPFPDLGVDILADQLAIGTEFVDSMLEHAERILLDTAESLFTEGVEEYDSVQVKTLTGKAYDLLGDGVRTGGQLSWQDELKPVLNENGAQIWVRNEYVGRYSC